MAKNSGKNIAVSAGLWQHSVMKTNEKKTMTLNLTPREMAVLEELTAVKGISKTGVMRLALRLLQTVDSRVRIGHKVMVEDEQGHEKRELVIL